MYRYAIKGLSGDNIHSIATIEPGEAFPDDRRFALLKGSSADRGAFDSENPKWLHKAHFLCAFTAFDLMATFDTEYRILEADDNSKHIEESFRTKRILTVWKRNNKNPRSEDPLLGPLDLSFAENCSRVSSFFSEACGEPVHLVSKSVCSLSSEEQHKHTHQFGNDRTGVQKRGDTRLIHVVNAATVSQLSEKVGIPLSPRRFRPNIIVDGWGPWEEFDVVGKSIICEKSGLVMDVIDRAVRCEGISVDPDADDTVPSLDVPNLLQKHYPEFGPFLGVYAVVKQGGSLCVDDIFSVVE